MLERLKVKHLKSLPLETYIFTPNICTLGDAVLKICEKSAFTAIFKNGHQSRPGQNRRWPGSKFVRLVDKIIPNECQVLCF